MSRSKLSLPFERRRAQLKSAKLDSQVKIAEHRERLGRINAELKAMAPKKSEKLI